VPGGAIFDMVSSGRDEFPARIGMSVAGLKVVEA
jgi:hypothetical protein